MGGNALRNTVTRRYSASEYFELVDQILDMSKIIEDIYISFQMLMHIVLKNRSVMPI
jgi:uncharacterized membrane protein